MKIKKKMIELLPNILIITFLLKSSLKRFKVSSQSTIQPKTRIQRG